MAASSDRPRTRQPTPRLTVKQAAKEAGCSESLVRKLVDSGEVPARRESYGVRGQERQRAVIDRRHLPLLKDKAGSRQAGRRGRGPSEAAPAWAASLRRCRGGTAHADAEERVGDLEALLRADLREPASLRELADRYPIVPPFGEDLGGKGLAALREALEAVRYYYQHGRAKDPDQSALLAKLHKWEAWPTTLEPLVLWGMMGEELDDPDSGTLMAGMEPVPAGKLPLLIAGYYMATARALVTWGLYPASRCKREKCKRLFVRLKPEKEHCGESCRKSE